MKKMRHDVGIYLDVRYDISDYFTHITTDFEIPIIIREQLGLQHTQSNTYFLMTTFERLYDNEKYVCEIIEKIINNMYEPGGEKFLECQENVEKLLKN